MSKAKKDAPKKKGANGYKLPDPIPRGEIITDTQKKKWQIGPSIGVGGFGEIYSASQVGESSKTSNPYVIKVEPHGNGPLFVEMHFYMRVCKQEDIAEWTKLRKLTHLGMPRFISSGSHECHNEKYRFLVMDRFSQDLWSLFLENNRVFPVETVLRISYQIINVLEYIHHKGYVHADIKGANLLLDMKSNNHIFLVDFGLASKYASESKPNPKRAHDGTREYTSRDAHTGAMTMRGDLEILGYNVLQWLCSKLPWEDNMTDIVKLHQQKTAFMSNVRTNLNKCFGKATPPDFLVKYFDYVSKMTVDQVPDYDFCRNLFKDGLKKCGVLLEGKLVFAAAKTVKSPPKRAKSPPKKVQSPAKKVKLPAKKAAKRVEVSDSDEDVLDATPSPAKRRRQAVKVKPVAVSSSDDIANSDDEEYKPKKAAAKKKAQPSATLNWRDYPAASVSERGDEEEKKEAKSKREDKKKPAAPSWKDHPAAMASNIGRPGEYTSVNGASKAKKRQLN